MTVTFHDLADLVASLTTPPIGVWWQGNTANDAPPEWSIQTATCADFDRLAKLLPTSPSKRWLNGDQRHSMTTTRTLVLTAGTNSSPSNTAEKLEGNR